MRIALPVIALVLFLGGRTFAAAPDETKFSTHLHGKMQVRGCTVCHDFFEKKRAGLSFKSHKGRGPDECMGCHASEVTGFAQADEWFAMPGLYTSKMSAKQACEAIKTAMHARFKSQDLLARQMEKHLLEDPRVLWAIEGATPQSGALPEDKKQTDLVKGGLAQWKAQVQAWVRGGMKCE